MAKRRIDSCSLKHNVLSDPRLEEDGTSPSLIKRPRFSIDDLLRKPTNCEDSSDSMCVPNFDKIPNFQNLEETNTLTDESDEDQLNPSSTTPNSIHDSELLQQAQLTPNWAKFGNSPMLSKVECYLEGKELWAKFYKLSTEMIITKSGRRMFPTVKARLEGCDPDAQYYVFLDVVPVDAKRYRYVYNKSAWLTAGKAEASPHCRLYMHPDSPYTGRQLATQVISFEKAKLTNNDVDRVGHLVLNSMHKYQPRVHVVRRDRTQKPLDGNSSNFDITQEDYKTFQFTETQFMAVTAYQNQLITKLKIEKNPFAKGFRDPSGRNGDLYDISRQFMMENIPRQMFDPAAAAFLFQQCWPPSLFDTTNLPKLFNLPPFRPPNQENPQVVNPKDPNKQKASDTKIDGSPKIQSEEAKPPILPTNFPPFPPHFIPNFGGPHSHNLLAALGLMDPQQLANLMGSTERILEPKNGSETPATEESL